MKKLTLFLFTLPLLAQSPPLPPTNVRIIPTEIPRIINLTVLGPGTNNPLGNMHYGQVAYWIPPLLIGTNYWIVESSTNGIDWSYTGNETAYLDYRSNRLAHIVTPHYHFTETSLETSNWMVRIRR